MDAVSESHHNPAMRRSRHNVFAKVKERRYVVLWDFQRKAIEVQRLEQGSDCTALRQRPRGAASRAIINATL